MDARALHLLFRRLLAASIVAPGVAAPFACGTNDAQPRPPTSDSDGATTTGDAALDDGQVHVTNVPPYTDARVPLLDAGCVATLAPVPDADCFWSVPLPCGLDGGALSATDCQTYCGPQAAYCSPAPTEAGYALGCGRCFSGGRRPEGFVAASDTVDAFCDPAGAYFARMAELEAASVHAFERLALELSTHGAPPELVARARKSADDERRHARLTSALARRFGGKPQLPAAGPMQVRPLEAIATENAIEGCVRETFGALVATAQAERAADLATRTAMTVIAEDETDHAALSWSIAEWLDSRLDDDARARVDRSRREAVLALAADIGEAPPLRVRALAGLPSTTESRSLAARMEAELWT